MAIHQSLVDGGWPTARHLEPHPMQESSAAEPPTILATRKHARTISKVTGALPLSGWSGYAGKGRAGCGKGDWAYRESREDNKGYPRKERQEQVGRQSGSPLGEDPEGMGQEQGQRGRQDEMREGRLAHAVPPSNEDPFWVPSFTPSVALGCTGCAVAWVFTHLAARQRALLSFIACSSSLHGLKPTVSVWLYHLGWANWRWSETDFWIVFLKLDDNLFNNLQKIVGSCWPAMHATRSTTSRPPLKKGDGARPRWEQWTLK